MKRIAVLSVVSLIVAFASGGNVANAGQELVFRKPVPEGVVEIKGFNVPLGGIVELKDGSLILSQGGGFRISTDGGLTWGEALPPKAKMKNIVGLFRLKSGALAIYGHNIPINDNDWPFSLSTDEGKTWSEPTAICPLSFSLMNHSMVQLSSGRLLLTFQQGWAGAHPDLDYHEKSAYGLWRGKRIQIEGHGHIPEFGMSVVFRSDNEGKNWNKDVAGRLMGWFDAEGVPNGRAGQTSCFEPTVAETKDGGVLLLARSAVGRLVQSYSPDGGENWYAVTPSQLASSASPAVLARIPQTGDLLVVWNQVSRDEIRLGHRRGRLSVAISRDGGHSWEHFKTLELSDGLRDISHLPGEYPIQMVRARDWVGPLPDGWAWFHYANVDVIGDTVFISYTRGTPVKGVAEQNLKKQETVMRIYPLEWFYK